MIDVLFLFFPTQSTHHPAYMASLPPSPENIVVIPWPSVMNDDSGSGHTGIGESWKNANVLAHMPHLAWYINPSCSWASSHCYADGDLTIATGGGPGAWGYSSDLFRVYKVKVEGASPVLAKMLNIEQCSFFDSSNMFHIRFKESHRLVKLLLDAIYCEDLYVMPSLFKQDQRFVHDVWVMASKYEMHLLATYASDILM